FEDAGVQPLANQPQNHTITYPAAQNLPHACMVEGVEKLLDIDLHDPTASPPHRDMLQLLERLMRRAPRPEAVRKVVEVLLVDGFEQHRDRALQHLVLEGRDADGTRTLPIALRDVHSPDGRRTVRAGLRAIEQRPEVVLQLLLVLLRGLSVD